MSRLLRSMAFFLARGSSRWVQTYRSLLTKGRRWREGSLGRAEMATWSAPEAT